MFIVVAIVIFGIFVVLANTVFGSEGLTNDLKNLFEDSMEQATGNEENKNWVNILSNEDTRPIKSNNHTTHPIIKETLTEKGESYQRIYLNPEASGDHTSVYIPIWVDDLDKSSFDGEDVQFSISYRLSEPSHKVVMRYQFNDGRYKNEGKTVVETGSNGWKNIQVTIKNINYTEITKGSPYWFVALSLVTDEINGDYIDVKDVNVSVLK